MKELQARTKQVDPYAKGSPYNVVADAVGEALVCAGGIEPPALEGCLERIEAHRRLTVGRDAKWERRAWADMGAVAPETRPGSPDHQRTVGSAMGQGGELTLPLYATDLWSAAVRPAAVISQGLLGGGRPLPRVSSVHVPRVIVGDLAGVQSPDGSALASQDVTTGDAFGTTGTVQTVGSAAFISSQLGEMSPLGVTEFWRDLSLAAAAKVEAVLLAALASAASTTIDGSAGTTQQLALPLIARCSAAVGNLRLQPSTAILVAPRRSDWFAAGQSTTGSPWQSPGSAGCLLLGKPTYQTGAITAGATADSVYVCREDDLLYWATPPKLLVTAAGTAGTLQLVVRSYQYICAIFNRMPSGIAVLSPGLPAPAGY